MSLTFACWPRSLLSPPVLGVQASVGITNEFCAGSLLRLWWGWADLSLRLAVASPPTIRRGSQSLSAGSFSTLSLPLQDCPSCFCSSCSCRRVGAWGQRRLTGWR